MNNKTAGNVVETIIKAIVEFPEEVSIREVRGTNTSVYEIKVKKSDVGIVIGKKGSVANAIRDILSAASRKDRRTYVLEILE